MSKDVVTLDDSCINAIITRSLSDPVASNQPG